MDLKLTPLIKEHEKLGAKMAPFGGWLMPISYTGIIAEHEWTRQSVSLFDICHKGEFIIYGRPEETNLDKMLTVNLAQMQCGNCRYGFMLSEEGGIVDDLVVYKLADDKWMLVTNAACIDKDENHLKKYLFAKAKLENISEKTAKLDLQGPFSREVLKALAEEKIGGLKFYNFNFFKLLGEKIIISRTGYTGELGYELYITVKKTKNLWSLLLENKKVKPAGLGARDTLRLEMGYSLYGQDVDENTTPIEAGLEHFVDFNKDFIGRQRLMERKKENFSKRRVYLKTDSRRSPRHNYKIYDGEKKIGLVTSGTFSPTLSCGIGMGYVTGEREKLDFKILLKNDKIQIPGYLVEKPFYKKSSLKK